MIASLTPLRQRLQQTVDRLAQRLSPRQRQYAMLLALLAAGIGLLWAVFASGEATRPATGPRRAGAEPPSVTHIGVMSPGQQVNAVDQWVGTAGTRLAQYESERESQARLNAERQAFETRAMQRFAELEQRLVGGAAGAAPAAATSAASAGAGGAAAHTAPVAGPLPGPRVPPVAPMAPPSPPPAPAVPPPPFPSGMPPAAALPVSPLAAGSASPSTIAALRLPHAGAAGAGSAAARWPAAPVASPDTLPVAGTALPLLSRVRLADGRSTAADADGATASAGGRSGAGSTAPVRTLSTFLPVGFTRGVLLGGLDAPTGGQAQSNPHPVLIRLADNAILPNRFRGDYRECFVIAAGYGDISSERAYLRTENLSCVRADGGVLEVRIQGSVYGEDGKVGMRGRLVTKQGQLLANALLAGVVSGIGQGIAGASTQVSSSPLGTITSASGSDALKAGVGNGVGRALDRLAQYYIKLAENTFPVIEVDAGREIDVVITRGVRIDTPMVADSGQAAAPQSPASPMALQPGTSMQTRRPGPEEDPDAQD